MRLLQRMGKQLVFAIDLELEMPPTVIHPLVVKNIEQQWQRFLLHLAAAIEVGAEAVEFVFAIAGAGPGREAAVAENTEKGRFLGNAKGVGERKGNHARP